MMSTASTMSSAIPMDSILAKAEIIDTSTPVLDDELLDTIINALMSPDF
jgi:hypothetical protein